MRSVAVELTGRCNQKCTYCYNAFRADGGVGIGEMPLEKLQSVLARVIDENNLQYVTLTGGEPFTRKDIHEIIDFINDRGLGVSIISNGGLIRDETAARLAQQKVHQIQITLAGPDAETHDNVAGRGSYDRIIAAIERLVDAGVRATGSFLCTSQSAHRARETMERFFDLGITQIAFNRFNPSGFSRAAMHALMPTRSQVVEALEQTEETAARLDLDIICTMPIPPCVVDYGAYPHVRFGQCSAGDPHGEPAIGPDGQVKLCTLLGESVGTVFDGPLDELVAAEHSQAFRKNVPDFCRGCLYQDSCLGGCGAAAQWVLGAADEVDPFVAQHVMPDFEERASKRLKRPIETKPGRDPLSLNADGVRLEVTA